MAGRKNTGKPAIGGRPTLKTIAQLSGLAVPTVSRALNDAPDIGQRTKQRVRKIAQDIGYVPDRAGVRLRTGRSHVISMVVTTSYELMNNTTRLISAAAASLHGTPYHLTITPCFPDRDPLDPIRYVVETGAADAIIMNQTEPQDARVAYLMARGFPFVTHGRTDWAAQHAYYDFDNAAFARIAVQRLAARQHDTILLLPPPLAQTYAINMVEAAKDAAAAAGITLVVETGAHADSASEDIITALRSTLGGRPEITAMIAPSTSSAMAAVSAIEQNGGSIGQQIDLLAKEAMPFLKLFRADILTVDENVGVAGEFLVRAALRAIQDPAAPPMQHLEIPT